MNRRFLILLLLLKLAISLTQLADHHLPFPRPAISQERSYTLLRNA